MDVRRTIGAVALVLLPIALADDMAAVATAASSAPINTVSGFGEAFAAALGVIFATELGDKTFFIAAIMAMRHPRLIVWAGAVAALAAMTVLSTIVGHVAPMLLPPAVSRPAHDHIRAPSHRPLSSPSHGSLPTPLFPHPVSVHPPFPYPCAPRPLFAPSPSPHLRRPLPPPPPPRLRS